MNYLDDRVHGFLLKLGEEANYRVTWPEDEENPFGLESAEAARRGLVRETIGSDIDCRVGYVLTAKGKAAIGKHVGLWERLFG